MADFPLMLVGEWFKQHNTEYIWLGNHRALNMSSNQVQSVVYDGHSFTRITSPEMKRISFWLGIQRQDRFSDLITRLEHPKYIKARDVSAGQKVQYNGNIFIGLSQPLDMKPITIKFINLEHRLCELYPDDIVEPM